MNDLASAVQKPAPSNLKYCYTDQPEQITHALFEELNYVGLADEKVWERKSRICTACKVVVYHP